MSAMFPQVDGDDASLKKGGSSGALRDQSGQERPLDVLRRVPGNDACADCGAADPDWASQLAVFLLGLRVVLVYQFFLRLRFQDSRWQVP